MNLAKVENSKSGWFSVKSLSQVQLFATPWAVAHQTTLSMGFSRQESCGGLPFPSPGDHPDPGIEPRSPALQTDSLPSGKFINCQVSLEKRLILKFWKWFGNLSFSGANTVLIFIPRQWKIFLINRTNKVVMSQLRKLIGTFSQERRKERKDKDRDVHFRTSTLIKFIPWQENQWQPKNFLLLLLP